MTHEEYQQFVRNSEAFQKLGQAVQQKILNAADAEQNNYIRMLRDADTSLLQAKNEFINGADAAIKTMKKEAAGAKKEFLVKAETATQAQDVKEADELIANYKS